MTRIKEQALFSQTGPLSQSYHDQLALLLSTPQGTVYAVGTAGAAGAYPGRDAALHTGETLF